MMKVVVELRRGGAGHPVTTNQSAVARVRAHELGAADRACPAAGLARGIRARVGDTAEGASLRAVMQTITAVAAGTSRGAALLAHSYLPARENTLQRRRDAFVEPTSTALITVLDSTFIHAAGLRLRAVLARGARFSHHPSSDASCWQGRRIVRRSREHAQLQPVRRSAGCLDSGRWRGRWPRPGSLRDDRVVDAKAGLRESHQGRSWWQGTSARLRGQCAGTRGARVRGALQRGVEGQEPPVSGIRGRRRAGRRVSRTIHRLVRFWR
jgi:hypothetical protein